MQVMEHAQGYPGVARAVGEVDSRCAGRYRLAGHANVVVYSGRVSMDLHGFRKTTTGMPSHVLTLQEPLPPFINFLVRSAAVRVVRPYVHLGNRRQRQ
jgi:hypothetical protein